MIDEKGLTIGERIQTPAGFQRVAADDNTFAHYLRRLPLKSPGAKVRYYNGTVKEREDIYIAVVDMDIGRRDLQQCADAIMRLRAEYLYRQNKGDLIHFNLTNGFRMEYFKWKDGWRPRIDADHTRWIKAAGPSASYREFRKYLDFVFAYAGTLSLSRELESIDIEDLESGDIFIRGGSPGHAVIVVDTARNSANGEIIFLLAQSYMPAQDIQILQNPGNRDLNPWYSIPPGDLLMTPEWTFKKTDLKRFADE